MNQFMELLGEILKLFVELIPKPLLINVSQAAVRMRRGRNPTELKPGFYIYWPILTEVYHCSRVRQAVVLPERPMVTKDGKKVTAGAVVAYEIADAVKALVYVHDVDTTVGEIAQVALPMVVMPHTFDQLLNGFQGSLSPKGRVSFKLQGVNKELTNVTRNILGHLGVKVIYARFNSLAPCIVLSHTGGPTTAFRPVSSPTGT